ncbi:MAG: MFS transporter, partial [Chloroflexota bacterium]|nr:MFS transporter [Chloroflexota bacterium]
MVHARGREGESGVRRARGVFFGWYVVLACFFIALFAWGLAFYGNGVYLAALRARHGWPTALIASATTAFYLVGAALLTVVGTAIERFGPRRVVLVGMAALGAGVLALAVVTAPWQLYVAYLAMAVGWATMSLTA